MGGHGHPPEVPSWKIYRVENSSELMAVKKRLEARGLCWPWLRNEVWKYKKTGVDNIRQMIKFTFFGGFKYGLGAALITIAIDKAYMAYAEQTYGGHGHHEEHH